ncbi:transposase family protein [Rathayibacter tanaceti]|uniref:DDE Tnp4 domain-containing protein n=1 Tax=Rathayibacter tanaceti TaxID=1671680 RepID=A0A162J0E5_9MICO|nr:transposase family protein [Rathayibacter tanaceti]KZX20387.1 hypothetical protein ACH61_02493 [Rathayibacter tanaceti]QHC54830.1 hypothetical protein GSU10_03670 [Rathayibacter tanaceti]
MQRAADLDGSLLAASDPIAGARHDRAALALCGGEPILDDADWIADPGCIGTTATTPRRRSRGSTLDENTKKSNGEISRTRSAVERCISHFKNWKIIATGYRGRLTEIPAITKLKLYRLGW